MQISPKEKNRLFSKQGKWAIITGATSGIGLELGAQLAAAGLDLLINSRRADKIQEAEKLLKANSNIKMVVADVSETEGSHQIIQAAQD